MLNTALRFMSECDRAGLKYRESRDMDDGNSVVVCAVNGKNNARYDVVLIFSQDERNVSLRVFNTLNFPEEKALDIMKLCNELNGRYRWVKLFTRQDHLELQIDAVISEETSGPVCVELLVRTMKIVDEIYPQFMKALWS